MQGMEGETNLLEKFFALFITTTHIHTPSFSDLARSKIFKPLR